MRTLLQTVEKVLDHDVPVLILGESGTGKDHLASAIHACSRRRDYPLVAIDLASVPHELFESELLGHEKGTFTDAVERKIGKLELAGAGTVYFDDIASLSSPLQAKLLRAIQEKSFERLGGHQPVAFSARVISSAGTDLDGMLASGALRRDLFYRINVVRVSLPPLRERREDILPLAAEFAPGRSFGEDAAELLLAYPWPGNVRELKNAMERAVLTSEGTEITASSLPFSPGELVAAASNGRWTLDQLEASYIREVLAETRSNYSRAALILGINRKTLLEKRRKYGLG